MFPTDLSPLTPACEPPPWRACLSGRDALALLDLIDACVRSATEADLTGRVFPRLQGLLSFDHASALLCRQGAAGGLLIDQAFNHTYPAQFVAEFMAKDYFQADILFLRHLATRRPQRWSSGKRNLPVPKEIWSLCLDFKMDHGLIHGLAPAGADQPRSVFFFTSRTPLDQPRDQAILECLTPHLHAALRRTLRQSPPAPRQTDLTAREKDVLLWLQEGKTSWETSVILGVSERTVNFHVRNLLRKLGALNRPQAVAIAARQGLLRS